MLAILTTLYALLATAYACGEVGPRAEVICYSATRTPPPNLDACHCTVLVVEGASLDHDLLLNSDADFASYNALKIINPDLKVVASLGGERVKGDTFSLLTSSADAVANLTQATSTFLATHQLDGLEVDWRWPSDAKAKEDLTTLIKVLRLVLDQKVHNVTKRAAPEEDLAVTTEAATEATTETTTLYEDEGTTTLVPLLEDNGSLGKDYDALESGSEYAVTVQPLEDEDYLTTTTTTSTDAPTTITTTVSVPNSTSSITTTTTTTEAPTQRSAGWTFGRRGQRRGGGGRRRGVVRKRLLKQVTHGGTDEEEEEDEGKLLILAVAPNPEYIVKGYDLKELAKVVDFFSLPTHNLTIEDPSMTYHPGRLMGLADLQNADSLVDLAAGLGVPLEKLVLSVPETVLSFTLENATLTTPRSPGHRRAHVPCPTPRRARPWREATGRWRGTRI
ncbi:hypothetical protein O3P69_015961 [Scylla paramamosain]|uniref:GH18 domain-containing protein n=1 Tax=Scylla paramamosain TaxID=85552 RepID=A0AAW0T8A3_SCYPA